jgi:hypothetical protein
MKAFMLFSAQDIIRCCELNPRRLPNNGGTVVLDLDQIWKPV